jgi:hypothetical protein
VVYSYSFFYDDMDVDDNMISKCIYCSIPRDKMYMGGGLYVYRCPKCGSELEMKK